MAEATATTDHEAIRHWIEQRKGRPSIVKHTESTDGESILRIEFRHPENLEDVDWPTFFKTFEDRKLAFLHQDKTADGAESRFFKFIKREH